MKYRIHWLKRKYLPTEIEAEDGMTPLGSWMLFRDVNGRIILGANDKQIHYVEQIE